MRYTANILKTEGNGKKEKKGKKNKERKNGA
jgi:hypothetical protein